MNKLIFSTTLLSTLISTSSFAFEVYSNDDSSLLLGGRVEPRFNVSDANEVNPGDSSFEDISRARIYIDGATRVNDDVSVFGYYNGELTSESNASDIENRYMFAGVATGFGAFSYGKQDSAQVILTDVTDIMATFGGSASDLVEGNQDKRENNFVYELEIPFGVTATANYIASDKDDNDSAGLSLIYDDPIGFAFGVGYVDGKQVLGAKNVDANQMNVVASYAVGDFYMGGIYVSGEIDNVDVDGYEIAAAYALDDVVFRYVYNNRDADDKAKVNYSGYEVDYHAIEGVYNVTNNFLGYAGYEFNRLDGKQNDDQFQAGLRYNF
ncbi:porin [Enterovibrio norvegicus]|uniref:porin n=1 Tax=Enterovibrio norvegicus TaxID=188144 RepID=UPI0013D50BE2|nr:porin [Enterovibrio norvegicus]